MKKTIALITLTTSFALIAVFTNFTNKTQAQSNPIDLAVSPPTTYLAVKPGEKKNHTVTIEQQGTLPLLITPSMVDFRSDGYSGQPILETSNSFRYATIISDQDAFGRAFTLEPGQKKQINLVIDIPQDAIEEEYPLTILFTAQPSQRIDQGGSGSQITGVIGSNLVVTISTSDRDRGKLVIESLEAPTFVDTFGGINFTLTAKNNGQNATTASGSAIIKDWQDSTVADFELLPDMVLVNSTRQLRTGPSLQEVIEDPSKASDVFSYKPNFLFGSYTIEATLNHNAHSLNDDQRSIVSIRVIAFPFSVIIVLMVLILAYVGYTALVKSSRSKEEQNLDA